MTTNPIIPQVKQTCSSNSVKSKRPHINIKEFKKRMPKTESKTESIYRYGVIRRTNKRKRRTKYSKQEIDEWIKTLRNMPNDKLRLTYAINNYHLFHTFCLTYGSNSNDWYGALINIGFSKERIRKIRYHQFEISKRSKDKKQLMISNERKDESKRKLKNWFIDNRIGELPEEQLIPKRFKEHFPKEYDLMNVLYDNYGIAFRDFGVPEKKILRILEISIETSDFELRERKNRSHRIELSRILGKILDAKPELIEKILEEF